MKDLPTISIVIPTYNSEKVLPLCLESIKKQEYPKTKIELIVADGGSIDKTLDVAKEYTDKIFENKLKTGEAGKAVGIKHSTGEIIAFIDSDNILPSKDWLSKMVKPFEDEEIAGSEPLFYTYRKEDGYITRYCALIGMNDPLCLFFGNYDRYCYITNKWTGIPVEEEDKGSFLKVKLNEKKLPTIGANGFLVRRSLLKKYSVGDYLFDIDLVYELVNHGHDKFAKVKVGIVHLFSGNFGTFIKKQRRRIKDFSYYKQKKVRKYPWSSFSKLKLLKFGLYTILLLPLLVQSIKGWFRKKDCVWLFHIVACWATLVVYSIGRVQNIIFEPKIEDRSKW